MIRNLLLATVLGMSTALANPAYEVEPIPFEKGIDSQVGGIDVLADGRVVVCFHRGEVRIYNPKDETWSLFAEGFHEPLGIVAESDSSFVIMQRPELTRIADTDGDGKADRYETISDDFGMTGNYHEFAFGPARDKNGDWFVGLNVASNGASVREEVRGEFIDVGLPRDQFYTDWSKVKGKAGRMYSRTPYRGWVVKIDGRTGELIPWASGFRSPNGLGFDESGNLFVSDNQGDWLGTSKLHHVKKGRFHGHPASLPWTEGYDGRPPLEVPVEELEKLRTPASVWFPQGTMANSPTQPILIPDGFGPFTGQMLIGEMNRSRIIRLMLEEVNGVMQGACVPFIEEGKLPRGVNRFAFGPDQTLWTGHTHLSWAGSEGMSKIQFQKDENVQEVYTLSITKSGFKVKFTEPVADLGDVKLKRYTYKYHSGYGSPELEKADLTIEAKRISENEFQLEVGEPLKKDFVYHFDFAVAENPMVCYTVREIPE